MHRSTTKKTRAKDRPTRRQEKCTSEIRIGVNEIDGKRTSAKESTDARRCEKRKKRRETFFELVPYFDGINREESRAHLD